VDQESCGLFFGTQIMTVDSARLPADGWGLLLDRAQPVTFSFDGASHQGFAGDVVASALMASGRHVLSRSFKYHRPRGVLTMAGHDSNALVQVGAEPNVRGDRRQIAPGLAVTSINRMGRLDFDWLAVLACSPASCRSDSTTRPSSARMAHGGCSSGRSARWRTGTLDPKARHDITTSSICSVTFWWSVAVLRASTPESRRPSPAQRSC